MGDQRLSQHARERGGEGERGPRTASVLTDGIFQCLIGAQGGVIDGVRLVVAEGFTDTLVPWPAAGGMPIGGSTASTHSSVHLADHLIVVLVIALNHCESWSPRGTHVQNVGFGEEGEPDGQGQWFYNSSSEVLLVSTSRNLS